ncbi:hypothetical protein X566_13705 [Afipia sp. P52-10]|nr:hypothetical protein X566_13705 [Afipia sp. P52-10]
MIANHLIARYPIAIRPAPDSGAGHHAAAAIDRGAQEHRCRHDRRWHAIASALLDKSARE